MVVYQTTSLSLRAASITFWLEISCAPPGTGTHIGGKATRRKLHRTNVTDILADDLRKIVTLGYPLNWFRRWKPQDRLPAPQLLLRPAQVDRHVDPIAVGILDPMVGVFICLHVNFRGKTGILEPAFDLIKIVDLKTKMIEALLLILTFGFYERDIDTAVGHVDRASET